MPPGGDQQRPAPRGYEAAPPTSRALPRRRSDRLRVALDPGDRYGPADADTTRADAYGAHPSHAAGRHHSETQRAPERSASMVSQHYERKSLAKKSYT
jgi:hypothetical protein